MSLSPKSSGWPEFVQVIFSPNMIPAYLLIIAVTLSGFAVCLLYLCSYVFKSYSILKAVEFAIAFITSPDFRSRQQLNESNAPEYLVAWKSTDKPQNYEISFVTWPFAAVLIAYLLLTAYLTFVLSKVVKPAKSTLPPTPTANTTSKIPLQSQSPSLDALKYPPEAKDTVNATPGNAPDEEIAVPAESISDNACTSTIYNSEEEASRSHTLSSSAMPYYDSLAREALGHPDNGDAGVAANLSIHVAARRGDERLVQALLRERAENLELRDENGMTALHHAAAKGHLDVLRVLLDSGGKVWVQDCRASTALHHAARNGRTGAIRLLRANDADPEVRDAHGSAALHDAALHGQMSALLLLLEYGTDIYVQNNEGGTALSLAARGGHAQVVKMLLAQEMSDEIDYGKAMLNASAEGHLQVVRLLLARIPKTNQNSQLFNKALYDASAGGYGPIIRLLLDHGAEINHHQVEAGNALKAAAYKRHLRIVQLLLQRGADVNLNLGFDGTALHSALLSGKEAIIRQLCEAGADVNTYGKLYGCMLEAAIKSGNPDIVEMILEQGVDPNEMVPLYGNGLQMAAARGEEAIVRHLLNYGADINARGCFGGTNALMAACASGHASVVRLLLKRRIDVLKARGRFGNVIETAAYLGHTEVIRVLLEKCVAIGAEWSLPFRQSLRLASEGGHHRILKLLLQDGDDEALAKENLATVQILKILLFAGAKAELRSGYYT